MSIVKADFLWYTIDTEEEGGTDQCTSNNGTFYEGLSECTVGRFESGARFMGDSRKESRSEERKKCVQIDWR